MSTHTDTGSADHAGHGHHAPEAPERSSTLLWTFGMLLIMVILVAWFAHWYKRGAHHARNLGPFPKTAVAVAVDHAKLIEDRGPEVLDLGTTVYAKNCASCHGVAGVPNPATQPPPRDFTKDALKNANGSGPHALYLVLVNGFEGRMPAMPALSAKEKYAVVHYIRETWLKTNKNAKYEEKDPAKVQELIPKPGATAGPPPPPHTIPEPAPVRALMSSLAAEAAAVRARSDAWLERAAANASPLIAAALRELRASGRQQLIADLHQAAAAADGKERFLALLVSPEQGGGLPWFVLRPQADLAAIHEHMRAAAQVPAAAGVK